MVFNTWLGLVVLWRLQGLWGLGCGFCDLGPGSKFEFHGFCMYSGFGLRVQDQDPKLNNALSPTNYPKP